MIAVYVHCGYGEDTGSIALVALRALSLSLEHFLLSCFCVGVVDVKWSRNGVSVALFLTEIASSKQTIRKQQDAVVPA